MIYFRLDCYSHYFKLTSITREIYPVINALRKHLKHYQYVRGSGFTEYKAYFTNSIDFKEFRFAISNLDYFLRLIKEAGIDDSRFIRVDHLAAEGCKEDIRIRDGWTPRDYQVPVIEYFKDTTHRRKFLGMETGGGKTYSSLQAVADIGLRTAVVLKGTFIDKWVNDIYNTTYCGPDDVMVVKGGNNLRALIELAISGELKAKFIIISNRTLYNFVKEYEKNEADGYGCKPDELYEVLGVGIRIIDELHLDFHTSFLLDLYTNVHISISLSATLVSRDAFLMKMYEVAYPTKHRYKSVDSEPYINAIAVDYTSNRNYNIRTTEYGSKNYSHHVYERSIMRNTKMKNDYYTMIVDILYKGFETDYLAGEKAVVFVYSLNMAADLANHLARVYPKLKVMRYVAEDSYDEMLTADIIVSTPQNLGTGIDLPELKMVLLTVNIDSIQSNTQILGRLRNRKGKPTRFYYIYNTSILKHREYHKRRKDLLLAKCKTYSEMAYGKIIG